jgi:hypothetical protein
VDSRLLTKAVFCSQKSFRGCHFTTRLVRSKSFSIQRMKKISAKGHFLHVGLLAIAMAVGEKEVNSK